ncbi:hypothetical protein Tco_0522054 [Tanacetum coccineum]
MWEAIKTRNLGVDRVKEARLQTLITEFKNLKTSDNDTIDAYATKLSGVFGRLKAYEKRVKEEDKANDAQENFPYARMEYSNRDNDSSRGRGCGSYSRGRGRGLDICSGRGNTQNNGQRDSSKTMKIMNKRTQEKDVYHEEGMFFMMNHIQETIFMNEEKYTPPKSESNTDEDDVWYFDNGASNHMTAWGGGISLFMPPEDEVLPAEEQPLPAAASPTADSPGYVPEYQILRRIRRRIDEAPEDPADYPADGGDDGDDEDESSDDDEDEDVDIKEDEEEEEHLAPADSTAVALPAVDHAPSAEETKPFETDKLLAIPTPPPSPLSPWSSPLPQIPSPPLPLILSPLPVSSPPPASPTYPLGYRAAMIQLRAKAPSTSHSPPLHIIVSHTRADTPPSGTPPLLPIPLPTSSLSLLLPSADHGADMPEVCLPPWKRLCFAFGPRYEVGESSSSAAARPTGGFKADYGFVATMDREIRRDL